MDMLTDAAAAAGRAPGRFQADPHPMGHEGDPPGARGSADAPVGRKPFVNAPEHVVGPLFL